MKYLIIYIIISFCIQIPIHATPDSLPSRDALFNALRTYHEENQESKTAEFRTVEKNAWMRWLPSVGLSYAIISKTKNGRDVIGSGLRPVASFSLNSIYENLNDRERIRAKIHSIKLSSNIEYRNDSLSLEILLKKLQILRGSVYGLIAAQNVDDEIWNKITKPKYEDNKISGETFLTEKRAFIERGETLIKRREEIQLLELEALKLAKY